MLTVFLLLLFSAFAFGNSNLLRYVNVHVRVWLFFLLFSSFSSLLFSLNGFLCFSGTLINTIYCIIVSNP